MKTGSDQFGKLTNAFRGSSADDGNAGRNFGRVRVDVVDGYALTNVMKERRCGVDYKARADDNKNVG